jgi:hypothetical protein
MKKVNTSELAFDLAMFVKSLELSLVAGVDILSFSIMFSQKFSKNQISDVIQDLTLSEAGLTIESLTHFLCKYPNQEAIAIAGFIKCGYDTGASISTVLNSHLDFIKVSKSNFSKLTPKEKNTFYLFLRLVAVSISTGMNIVQGWNFASQWVRANTKSTSVIVDLTAAVEDQAELIQRLYDISIKRKDKFLLALTSSIMLLTETGGNLVDLFEWMAIGLKKK